MVLNPTDAEGRPEQGGAPPGPATRDQADAYRFAVRRLEAALACADGELRHERIRSGRRAALAGVVLGLLGLCGAAVLAKVAPRPDWTAQQVVVGRESGTMHVVAQRPDRLVPVPNLAAARLVLAALGAPNPAGARPVLVPDTTLDGAGRTPATAVTGLSGRLDLPAVAPNWAICDRTDADGTLVATTVIGGAALGPGAGPQARVLLAGPDEKTWLIVEGHRHLVDTGDGAVLAAYRLARVVPRVVSDAVLSAIPEGVPLATPQIPDRGAPAPGGLPGRVGDVLVSAPVTGPPQHFVVLADGLAEVPEGPADLLRIAAGGAAPTPLDPAELGAAALTADPAARAGWPAVAGWPHGGAPVLEPGEAAVVCWAWSGDGPPEGRAWIGQAVPAAGSAPPVVLAGADGPGPRPDEVAVGPGGPVRATGPGRVDGAGPRWFVTAGGLAHGIADEPTAAALGLGQPAPAPETALRLLPQGPVLDLAAARRIVDVPTG